MAILASTWHQRISSGDLSAVLVWSALAAALVVAVVYAPVMFMLRDRVGTTWWAAWWMFPLTGIMLGFLPVMFISASFGGNPDRNLASSEGLLFGGMFATFGAAFGFGFLVAFESKPESGQSSVIPGMPKGNDDDWRLRGQDRYLTGARLVRCAYRRNPSNPNWDHDHCEFCSAKFMVDDLPDVLHAGYCTLDEYRWICATCFRDFRVRFRWEVVDGKLLEGG
jgi:hypothetical protein